MRALAPLICLALTGCASAQDYTLYVNSQVQIETARHAADAEKYKALALIAQSGSDTAKVAAVMSLGAATLPSNGTIIRPPQNAALQWASILIPGITNIAGIVYGARTSMNASNNAANVSMSTNDAFVNMAGKIQAPMVPQANVTTTNTYDNDATNTTSTSLNGTGVIGAGTYAPVNITANRTKTVTDSYNPTQTLTQTQTLTDNSVTSPVFPPPPPVVAPQ